MFLWWISRLKNTLVLAWFSELLCSWLWCSGLSPKPSESNKSLVNALKKDSPVGHFTSESCSLFEFGITGKGMWVWWVGNEDWAIIGRWLVPFQQWLSLWRKNGVVGDHEGCIWRRNASVWGEELREVEAWLVT